MTATTISAADKATILRSLDGVLPEAHAQKLHDFLFITLPAMILSDLANLLQTVKDVTALKAIDVTTLQDKAVLFAEDVGQLFQYDADSSAVESLGPPAMIVQPTAGAGRYIALTLGFYATPQAYVDARLRLVADVNAVKAIDVTTLVDKALVYVEGTGQFFAYDAQSAAAEVLGPPATVIQPTAGVGRYLVFVGTTAYVDARIRLVADNTALKAVDVTTLVDKALIFKEDTRQLFQYDADSAATELLGPPARVISPTAGAGRYLSITLGDSQNIVNNYAAATDPGATDDSTPAGYAVGSKWLNTVTGQLWLCTDATNGAAVWVKLTNQIVSVATTAAMTALNVAALADKTLVYVEDTDQLFHYDADSAAAAAAGPPATCLAPDAGAGRYLLHDNAVRILRVCADNAAVKALKVDSLADRALVYKEDTQQIFAYDADSVAAEALGPPATVIQPTAGAGRYLALTLGGLAIPQSYFDARVRLCADNAAVKAIDVATLVDKSLIVKEDTQQLFLYDAESVAGEVLGPPARVIQPTAGAGRYIALSPLEQRVRVVADTAAAKALDVATLDDRALVYVEALLQLFAYDANSAAAEALGPPVSVIQPTAGAGRYIALTNAPANIVWTIEKQIVDPGAGDELPATANGTYALANRLLGRAPCKGILSVWYIGDANPVGIDDANTSVFKIIKNDDTALITKTFNTATQPGNAYVPTLLGSVQVAAGDMLAWEVVNGATADLPKFGLQFDIVPIA